MATPSRYDTIIIGTGQGGVPLATSLAQGGQRVAIIERSYVGGTCVNYGCTPTKTMVASARVAYLSRRGADYGIEHGPTQVDLRRVRERKRHIVDLWRSGSEKRVTTTEGLDFIAGEASFQDRQTLHVAQDGASHTIQGDNIVINTGTTSIRPPINGLETVGKQAGHRVLDHVSIMELEEVPAHLVVVGGGYIGLEFSQMFRRFGAEVTIIQRSDQLVPREDPDIAEAVAEILRDDGITVLLGSEATSVAQQGEQLAFTVTTPGGEQQLRGSHLLLAAGRGPNTKELKPENAGVHINQRGFIPVDEHLKTNVPGIFAMGDVTGGPMFTHISYNDYFIVKDQLTGEGQASTAGRLVPYTVFIDPQLGRVGLNEKTARDQGRQYLLAKLPMKSVARAAETDEPRGLMKALIDPDDHTILGATILGLEGGEIMGAIQLAMMGGLKYEQLRDGIFAHPTLIEGLNSLFAKVSQPE